MKEMFCEASSFNGDVSKWNTAAVTDMSEMFSGASSFNGDVSNWNTAAVVDMVRMFHGASSFNGDVSKWNTAAVTTMTDMFSGASSFSGDVSKLHSAAVTSMDWIPPSQTSNLGSLVREYNRSLRASLRSAPASTTTTTSRSSRNSSSRTTTTSTSSGSSRSSRSSTSSSSTSSSSDSGPAPLTRGEKIKVTTEHILYGWVPGDPRITFWEAYTMAVSRVDAVGPRESRRQVGQALNVPSTNRTSGSCNPQPEASDQQAAPNPLAPRPEIVETEKNECNSSKKKRR